MIAALVLALATLTLCVLALVDLQAAVSWKRRYGTWLVHRIAGVVFYMVLAAICLFSAFIALGRV